jgi:hypothetical protein
MPWTYYQSTGVLEHNGKPFAAGGYSGAYVFVNNPDKEAFHDMGPIPRGNWWIGPPTNYYTGKKYALPLTPVGHQAYGRKHILIHGDLLHRKEPGHGVSTPPQRAASSGCIILSPEAVRRAIWQSGDRALQVLR